MSANRFAVPLESLETVRVACTEQVEMQAEPYLPQPSWGLLPYLDGGVNDDDGD